MGISQVLWVRINNAHMGISQVLWVRINNAHMGINQRFNQARKCIREAHQCIDQVHQECIRSKQTNQCHFQVSLQSTLHWIKSRKH